MRPSAVSSGTESSIENGSHPAFAVILGGGSGTRLWPLARAGRPKQFLPLFGGKSLFRLTYERIVPLVGPDRVLVVAGSSHSRLVRAQVPELAPAQLVLEELGRNTGPAIGLAALRLRRFHRDAIMVVLPSDHWIRPATPFRRAVWKGIAEARRKDRLVILGVAARSAETGFGYVRTGARGVDGVHAVAAFIEKPAASAARRMIRTGGYLWNTGIFVGRAGRILGELQRHAPEVLPRLDPWARRATGGLWRVPRAVLAATPAVPIDTAVMERAKDIAVVRGRFDWSDLGSWAALADLLEKEPRLFGARGQGLTMGSRGCIGINDGGLTVLVGVRDVVVVRSGRIVLVCRRDATQGVRRVVERLKGKLAIYR